MMSIGERTRDLKDALFNRLSDVLVTDKYVDSITDLIGRNVAESDREAFRHFREIEGICTDKQKEKFNNIIKDAIGKGSRKGNGQMREGMEENRQRPPRDGERMGPPMDGERMGPPRNGDRMEPPMDRERMGPPPNH
jgi:hypothetical protein